MFKKILVSLGDSPNTETALYNTCELASKFGSQVVCLYVTDLSKVQSACITCAQMPEMMVSLEPCYEPEIVEEINKEMLREESVVTDYFEEYKKLYPQLDITLEKCSGEVHTEILARVKNYDLLVMGKTVHEEEDDFTTLGESFHKVIHKSTIPVLACTKDNNIGANLLLCYDGKKPAKKALEYAIATAEAFRVPLNILTAGMLQQEVEEINEEALKKALSRGVEVVQHVQPFNTVGAITGLVKRLSIDFLFMGAYGDNPVKDLFLGSTTDMVLKQTGCPILLCR
ncbi:MAG: universal stress protein [Firmicutes bacterium]|nr:universal stress protein [Bacillota bacterium]